MVICDHLHSESKFKNITISESNLKETNRVNGKQTFVFIIMVNNNVISLRENVITIQNKNEIWNCSIKFRVFIK